MKNEIATSVKHDYLIRDLAIAYCDGNESEIRRITKELTELAKENKNDGPSSH
jgi:hypothetical protein